MPTTQTGAPLSAARFRVNVDAALTTIATQTRVIVFHFGLKELSLKINQDANPQTFLDVAQFALHPEFTVDLLDDTGAAALTLGLVNPKLITHDFPLEFTSAYDAFHTFRFTYDSVSAVVPAAPVAPVATPVVEPAVEPVVAVETTTTTDATVTTDTPDVTDVAQPEVLELDAPLPAEYESRITPDHPDHNS